MRKTGINLPDVEKTIQAMADGTRLRILSLLEAGEVCVCHIHESLGLPQSKVSRHLAYLRRAGLVETRKQGLWVHYRLARRGEPIDTLTASVRHCLGHIERVQRDRRRLGTKKTCAPASPESMPADGYCESSVSQAPKKVVFACVHNAGRSQMTAALFNELADPSKANALSAGTHPGTAVHPEVQTAMREVGIDLSSAHPRLLTAELARDATMLITMGCGGECPYVAGVERDDWELPDPKGRPIEDVRTIRDDIRDRVAALIAARGWGR